MTADQFISWALGLLSVAAIAIVTAHLRLRGDFSDFKTYVAKEYITSPDIAKIECDIEAIKDELKSLTEIIFEIRADIRAGNLQLRTPHG